MLANAGKTAGPNGLKFFKGTNCICYRGGNLAKKKFKENISNEC